MKTKISIIVPVYNIETYLGECLSSLIAQTLEDIEIIIINDGSTDKGGDIAEQYAKSDSRISVFHTVHKGVSEARNRGIQEAQGTYITFVDGDDWILSEACDALFTYAETQQADIVLGNSMLRYNEDGTTKIFGDKRAAFMAEDILEGRKCFCNLCKTDSFLPMVCGNLYLKSFLEKYQLRFFSTYHEDEYFTPYALYYAERVTNFTQQFYFYRQRVDSIMHSDNLLERANSLFFIGKKLLEFLDQIKDTPENITSAYQMHACSLLDRGILLYEKVTLSIRKHLFIFSEESIGAQYGIGTYIEQLVNCFDLAEWKVSVVELRVQKKDFLTEYEVRNGVAYYQFSMQLSKNKTLRETQIKRHFRDVFYYLANKLPKNREVYCHFNFTSHYDLALRFKEKLQAKNIFTLHYTSWSFDLLGDRSWLECIKKNPIGYKDLRVVEKFESEQKFMLECCDYVIAIASHSYQMLKELYSIPEEKLVYIPNGLKDEYVKRSDTERLSLRKKYRFKNDEILILYAGRLDLIKGVVELIESFKLLLEEMPHPRLIIAGSGNISKCQESASPYWSSIVFTGFISKKQLYELHAIADVGIVPSFHEEFGYVAVEMMMNQLPVIVNNTTGLSEIVNNGEFGTVFHYVEHDQKALPLKNVMKQFFSEKRKTEQLQQARNRVLTNYSHELFRERIIHLYSVSK